MRILNITHDKNTFFNDGLSLAENSPLAVKHDANGVPVEWTILRIGNNEMTKCGHSCTLILSAEDMQSVIDFHAQKGSLIPIDSRHYLHLLARKKNLDESELLRMIPDGITAGNPLLLTIKNSFLSTAHCPSDPTGQTKQKTKTKGLTK